MNRHTLGVDADGIRLAVHVSGPREAPPVVLVHGYPDSASVWEPVRERLEARYRVIAYDVRGAGASQAPRSRADYRLARLANDLAAVADATCGARPFHLAAHDWGSIQSWEAVTEPSFAGRIASFTSISGPCLDHVALALRNGKRNRREKALTGQAGEPARRTGMPQWLKSWYIVAFHLPLLPELGWRLGGASGWPLWLRLTENLRVARDPDRLRNALNGLQLYRANFRDCFRRPRVRRAHAPVQFVVPLRDRYVGPELSLGLESWLGEYVRETVDGGHWMLLRDPERIAALIERHVLNHENAVAARPEPGATRAAASPLPSPS